MIDEKQENICEKDRILFEKNKFEYDRLWEYFKYHAKQRLETFRFFFIMAAIVVSGFLTFMFKKVSISSTKNYHSALPEIADERIYGLNVPPTVLLWIMLGFGIFLIVFSIIFWLLDNRNNTMISEARKLLIKMEKNNNFENKIFTIVKKNSNNNNSIRFHQGLRAIFTIFITIGFFISIYSICSLACS